MTGDGREGRDDLVVFARISRELTRETEIDRLLRLIVDAAVALVGGERGFLLLSAGAATGTSRQRRAQGRRRRDRRPEASRHDDPPRAQLRPRGHPAALARASRSASRAGAPQRRPLLSIDAGTTSASAT
jgi:hypothetical protein